MPPPTRSDTETLAEYNRLLQELEDRRTRDRTLSAEDEEQYNRLSLAVERLNERLRTSEDEYDKNIAVLKELNEVTQANITEIDKKIAKELENIRALRQSTEWTKEAEAQKRKDIAALQDQKDAINNTTRATKDFLITATGIDDRWKNTLLGSILSGNTEKNIQAFAETAKKQLSFENIIGSTMLKIQEATLEAFKQMDAAFSSFAAATGATAAYNDVITQTARGNTALGISFQQSGKAVTDLYTNLNTFSTLNQSTQAQLTVTTAKLERLGISGGDTAKSIASLSMMMGISEKQAAKTVEKFAAMGQAIGVSSKQMISDFMAVKDQLAVFGSSMDKTFTDLAAQAKATGVAVNDLLNLANKFDTFEGAANQVGKLNAILGGPYLSAMSMIEETDPTKRIDMLRQAVNNANTSFASMSYYEKKAIMDAGGFKSVEEAQRVLSMSAGAYAKELESQSVKQKELDEAVKRTIPIQEKFQLIMANFAVVIQPAVEMLSSFLSGIATVADKVPFLSYVLGGLIVAFTIIKTFQGISAMFSTLAGVFSFLTPAAAAAGPALQSTALGTTAVGETLAATSPLLVEGSAALGMFALVLLGVGAAIALVGLGFKLLFDGFAAILEQAVKAPEVFLYLAAGVLALGAAMSALALNPLMWIGMGILLASLFGIAAAFALIDKDTLFNFRVTMEKIVDVSQPATIVEFEKFSEKFEAVAKATAEVEVSKMQSFANMFTATQNLSESLKLDQTVIVKIGDKKFDGYIVEIVDKAMGDSSTSRAVNT